MWNMCVYRDCWCSGCVTLVAVWRALVGLGDKLRDCHNLVARLLNDNIQKGRDTFAWSLQVNGIFSVKSMYRHMITSWIRLSEEVWRTKLLMKIKIFMWYLVLTKDNLAKRNSNDSNYVAFVVHKRLSITFSLSVIMPDFYDVQYTLFLHHHWTSRMCSISG
jgi:hypothetical protein